MFQAEIVGQVGPSALSDGSTQAIRQGKTGELIISELHGRYYEQAFRQGIFSCSTAGAQTTTAGSATTWAGLALANPALSGVVMAIHKVFCTQIAASASSTSIGLQWSRNASVISGGPSPVNRLISLGQASKAFTATSATLTVTPVLMNTFAFIGTAALSTFGLVSGVFIDFEGSIVIPPDGILLTYTGAALTSTLQFGFEWEEVPA